MVERLKKYNTEHGNCCVPLNSKEDKELGPWVSKQRFGKDKLPSEKIGKLDSIGFVWDAATANDTNWNGMLEDLKKYKEENGNCRVPYRKKDYSQLANWVSRHRQLYKKGNLSEDRISKLNEVGFVWDATSDNEAKWNEQFEKLKQYKKEHGHCRVPYNYEDRSLANWVKTQRTQYKKEKLSDQNVKRLESLDFIWDASKLSRKL